MANLPSNSTYIPAGGTNIPKLDSKSALANAKAKSANMSSQIQEMMNSQSSGTDLQGVDIPSLTGILPSNITYKEDYSLPKIPADGRPYTAGGEKKAQPLSESGYLSNYSSAYGSVQPSDKAMVQTFPGSGQYISDPSQPNKIIRSARPDETDLTWKSIKEEMLEGRPGYLYNVDHIVPLWLGGTNNSANLSVLTRPEHANKTKAESVALTLYANGKITRDEAFYYATTWRHRDLTDIPAPISDVEMESGQTGGQLPLSQALKIKERWDIHETAAPKLSFMEKVKALVPTPTNLKRGGKRLAGTIDTATDDWNPFAQGVVKGLSTGLSFGAIKYTPEMNDRGGWETAGNITGNIAGMLAPVSLMAKVFGRVLGVGSSAPAIKEGLRGAGILKNTGPSIGSAMTSVAGGTASAVATTASKIKFLKATMNPATKATIDAMTQNFVRFTPAVVTYGQAMETFQDNPERGLRLMEDIFYGGVTGYMSPSLRGSAKVAVSSAMASLFFDGLSEHRPVTFENALINGLTMGALHGMAAPAVRAQAEQMLINQSSRTANDIVALYLPRIKPVGENGEVPIYSVDEVVQMKKELEEALMKQVGGSADAPARMDEAEFVQTKNLLDTSINTLLFRAMPEGKELDQMMATQLQLWANKANSPEADMRDMFGGVYPHGIEKRIANIPDDMLTTSIPSGRVADSPYSNYPGGQMKATGVAATVNPDVEGLQRLIEHKAAGKAAPTIVGFTRPERAPFYRLLSDNEKIAWKDSNPEHSIQLFALLRDAEGHIIPQYVGYVPQRTRIQDATNPRAFNSQAEIVSGKFKAYDPELNKDSIGEAMDKAGIDTIFLTLDDTGFVGRKPGDPASGNKNNPFLLWSLGDENWKRSIEWGKSNSAGRPSFVSDGAEAVLSKVNTTKNTDTLSAGAKDFVESYPEPAHTALDPTSTLLQRSDVGGIGLGKVVLQSSGDALSSKSSVELAQKLDDMFDVKLSEQEALLLFERRAEVTVEDMFSLIEKKSSPIMKHILNTEIRPNINVLVKGDEWAMRNVFLQMRILGKVVDTPPPVRSQPISPALAVADDATRTKETVTLGESSSAPSVAAAAEVPAATPQARSVAAVVTRLVEQKAPEMIANQHKATVMAEVPKAKVPSVASQTKLHTDIIDAASSILVPGKIIKRSSRQQKMDQILNDTISEGEKVINNIRYTERIGDEGYKKALAGVVKTVEPSTKTNTPLSGDVPLKFYEKELIRRDAQEELSRIAADKYFTKIDTESALGSGKNAIKKKDPFYQETIRLYQALVLRDVGDKGAALRGLRANLGDEVFESAYKNLYPNAKASDIAQIGKKIEKLKKPELGVKKSKPTDLLGDTTVTIKKPGQPDRTIDLEKKEITRKQGREVIFDMVDKPINTLAADDYARVRATGIDIAFTKIFGKDWRDNDIVLDIFSPGGRLWNDMMRIKGEQITQPKSYIKALARGDRKQADLVASERRAQVAEQKEITDNRKLSRGEERLSEQTEGDLDGSMDVEGITGSQIKTSAQNDTDNILAEADIDTVFAGFTAALEGGYKPTPQQAISDALRFVYKAKGAAKGKFVFHSQMRNETVKDILSTLKKDGIRLSNVKNPMKKAGTYYATAKSAKKEADKVLTGELNTRFKDLLKEKNPLETSYSKWAEKGVGGIGKIEALGEALKKQDWNAGIGIRKVDMTQSELRFLDSYKKYQNLMEVVHEANVSKEIMKLDAEAMKTKIQGQK